MEKIKKYNKKYDWPTQEFARIFQSRVLNILFIADSMPCNDFFESFEFSRKDFGFKFIRTIRCVLVKRKLKKDSWI